MAKRTSEPRVERRTVQLAGGTTYTVSVPKGWAIEHGIEPGAEVAVHPYRDGSILVRTEPGADSGGAIGDEPFEIECDALEQGEVERLTRCAYVVGFDAIVHRSSSGFGPETHRRIGGRADGLLGMEVDEQTDRRITFRTLLDTADLSSREAVAQLRRLVLPMHEPVLRALLRDEEVPPDVPDRRDEADRLATFVRRLHRTRAESGAASRLDHASTDECHATARELSRIADRLARNAALAERIEGGVPEPHATRLESLGERSRAFLRDASDVLLETRSIDRARDVSTAGATLLADLDSFEEGVVDAAGADYPLAVAIESVRLTIEGGRSIVERGLETAVRSADDRARAPAGESDADG